MKEILTRPNFEELANIDGYLECPCGDVLKTFDELKSHWSWGHFDYISHVETETDIPSWAKDFYKAKIDKLEKKLEVAKTALSGIYTSYRDSDMGEDYANNSYSTAEIALMKIEEIE